MPLSTSIIGSTLFFDQTELCPEVCPNHYEPVCGNDGVTYPNRCQLGLEACDNNDQLRALYAGACVAQPTGNTTYFQEYFLLYP